MRTFIEGLRFLLYLAFGYVPFAGADDVEGARGTANTGTNVLEPDYEANVAELEPNANPLLQLSKRMNKENSIQVKFNWFEKNPAARFDAINNGAGYTSGNTALVVDNGAQWHADDIIRVTRTGENLRVVSVATNTVTVIRAIGSTAAALLDNDELLSIGSAAQQGALSNTPHSNNLTEVFNYTQIFRRSVESTGTRMSSKDRTTPADWDRVLNEEGREYAKSIEYSAMFGHPALDTSGAQPRSYTGGWEHYCTQNASDVGGTMTEAELFASLRAPFRYTIGSTKLALAAMLPVDIVNAFPRGKLELIQADNDSTYGLKLQQLVTPHGMLNFVTHPLMEGSVYANQIWIVDVPSLGYRYLHGANGSRETGVRENIQARDLDGRRDEYLGECGFVFKNPLKHGKILNITS